MGIRICPKCNGKVSMSRNVCIHCGYSFPTTKKCPDCDEEIDINLVECPSCGYLFEQPDSDNYNTTASTDNKVEEIQETINTGTDTDKVLSEEKNKIYDNSLKSVEDNTPSLSHTCPYCGGKKHMQIGIHFYMCETCKMKFFDTSKQGFTYEELTNNKRELEKNIPSTANIDTAIKNNPVQKKICHTVEKKSSVEECFYKKPAYKNKQEKTFLIIGGIIMLLLASFVFFCGLQTYFIHIPLYVFEKIIYYIFLFAVIVIFACLILSTTQYDAKWLIITLCIQSAISIICACGMLIMFGDGHHPIRLMLTIITSSIITVVLLVVFLINVFKKIKT